MLWKCVYWVTHSHFPMIWRKKKSSATVAVCDVLCLPYIPHHKKMSGYLKAWRSIMLICKFPTCLVGLSCNQITHVSRPRVEQACIRTMIDEEKQWKILALSRSIAPRKVKMAAS